MIIGEHLSNKNKDRIVIHTRNLLYSEGEDWDTTCVVKVALRLHHSRELFWLKSDYPGDKLAIMQKIVEGHIEYYPKTFDVSIRDYLGDTQYKFRIVKNVEGAMPRLPLNETVFHYFGIRVYGKAVLVEAEEMEKLKTRRKMMKEEYSDTEFMKLDEELYTAIQNVINKFDGLKEFEINADSDMFNSYCELRNVISNKRGNDES